MAEYTIDKIEYGGNIYHLQDAVSAVDISSTYESATCTVTLTATNLTNADDTSY